MIAVQEVSKAFGARVLFDNVNVKFTPGNRYGLTGPNGAGKSTFMKILTGDIEPSNRGTITRPRKMGVLRQDQFAFDTIKVLDAVMMGNSVLWDALQERNAICAAADITDKMMERLGDLETTIADENGYMAEFEVAEILRGVGIDDSLQSLEMRELPTELKFRALLAQAVYGGPEALLLDEPTNHMDLESIHWLEQYLCEYTGVLIVISHDRHFLNAVCTHIADIDYETIIQYPGGYDTMLEQKMQARQSVESQNKDKARKILQLQEFVSRFAAGQRSSQVQSRRKEMARLAPTELKRSNIQRPWIRFDQNRASGRDAVTAHGVDAGYGQEPILSGVNLDVMRGDKLAIIGGSGTGKTTLIRTLIGELAPISGSVRWGHGMTFGYWPQDYGDLITPGMTALDWLMQFDTTGEVQIVRGLMGRMLFSGEEALTPTHALSGGETARLMMARIMMEKHPVLIFDEPTNHLDLESVNALAEGLSLFEGTVILVSHDRDLISEVASRILAFTPRGLIDYRGTYDEFLDAHPLEERAHSVAAFA